MYKKLIKMNSSIVFKYFIFLSLILCLTRAKAQTSRIAILDFQNISGISKYDGLGKAMSSMLISDIESNISIKRLQFVERGQIQKILKEQSFQASTNVNKASIVETGKLLGVNYILIGDVYILNDQLIINARLTNVKTGEIVFSKKQEGKTLGWLILKTNIAKEIAKTLSMPFTKPIIPDKEIAMQTITTFGDAIEAKDNGEVEIAEKMIQVVQEINPNFNYIIDLKKEVEEIKKRVENIEENLQILTTDPLTAAKNFDDLGKYADAEKYYLIGLKRLRQDQLGMYLFFIVIKF
jgi:TolB-like protein